MHTETHTYSGSTADVILTRPDSHLWLSISHDRTGITFFRKGQRFARTLTTDDVPATALLQGF